MSICKRFETLVALFSTACKKHDGMSSHEIDTAQLTTSMQGYQFLPGTIGPAHLTLVETDVPPVVRQPHRWRVANADLQSQEDRRLCNRKDEWGPVRSGCDNGSAEPIAALQEFVSVIRHGGRPGSRRRLPW